MTKLWQRYTLLKQLRVETAQDAQALDAQLTELKRKMMRGPWFLLPADLFNQGVPRPQDPPGDNQKP